MTNEINIWTNIILIVISYFHSTGRMKYIEILCEEKMTIFSNNTSMESGLANNKRFPEFLA